MIFTDVSKWNGVIDWSKQVAQGVEGTYIKATGCGDWGNYLDYKFKQNSESCPHKYKGAYHFFDYRKPGADQCKFFLDTVGSWGNLKGMLDIEDNSGSGWARLDGMYGTALKYAMEFVNQYALETGQYCGLYLNTGLARQRDWIGQYIFRNFTHLPLWIANYNDISVPPTGAWSKYSLWQYTSEADGILYGNDIGNKYIDLNRVNDLYSLIAKQVEEEPVVSIPVLSVPSFSQNDDSWRNDKLGFSDYTIGSHGCVITNLAGKLKSLGIDTDPGRLNKALIGVNGYEGANIIWDAITKLYPEITVDWNMFIKDASLVTEAKIDAVLQSKRDVMVQVDIYPSTTILDPHWVNLIGKDSNGYIMNDPIDGQTLPFKTRYTKALRTVVYSGNPAVPVIDDAEKLKRLWYAHTELH